MRVFPNTAPQEIRGTGVLTNVGPSTVYYSDQQDFDQSTSDGSLASGATMNIDGALWLIGGPAQVEVMGVPGSGGSGEVAGVDGRRYRVVSGVLRNNGASAYFQPIDDGLHRPQNIDSVSTNTTGITIVHNNIQATRVVAFMAEVDEVYAREGFTTGCSVGMTSTVISCYRSRELADRVFYNGSAWDFGSTGANTPFTVASFTSGVLRLTHATLEVSNPFRVGLPPVALVSANPTYDVVVNGTCNETEVNLSFLNASRTVVTTADTNMNVWVCRPPYRPALYNPQEMRTQYTAYTNSNIWVWGMWEVA